MLTWEGGFNREGPSVHLPRHRKLCSLLIIYRCSDGRMCSAAVALQQRRTHTYFTEQPLPSQESGTKKKSLSVSFRMDLKEVLV